MGASPGDPMLEVTSRLEAVRLEFDAQTRRFEDIRARLQATIDQVRKGRPKREILHASAFARLQAKLDTMPVIEQAKGVLMAQHRCGPEEAFDLLRRASQSANVKVSVLAAQIVEQVASAEPWPRSPRPAPGGAGRGGRLVGVPGSGRDADRGRPAARLDAAAGRGPIGPVGQ